MQSAFTQKSSQAACPKAIRICRTQEPWNQDRYQCRWRQARCCDRRKVWPSLLHLPHGYNGVPEDRIAALAKAVRDLDGPIYIHCHHGKHRSPTASTVACIAAGLISPTDATSNLKFAGTSDNYQGLYRAAANAKRIDDATLDALQVDFPAIAKIPPMAEAMVELDHTFDHVKQLSSNGWKPLAQSPDLDAAHEALLLREHFTEMLRLESVAKEPEAFRTMLRESESDARNSKHFSAPDDPHR